MSKRWRVIGFLIAGFFVVTLVGFRVLAVPLHPFEHVWESDQEVPLGAEIQKMAHRAELDKRLYGIRPIGCGPIVLDRAYKAPSGEYHLAFTPVTVSDTVVIYCFSAGGKMLWKTCTWTET
jgi:hypothetical protein